MTRVVVVDGEQLLQDVLPALFTGTGVQLVDGVGSWADFVRRADLAPDVLLLGARPVDDVPTVDKIGLARERGVRVVVISGSDVAGEAHTLLAAGAHGFVGRLDDAPTLVGAVSAAARGRQYLSPRVRAEFALDGVPRQVPALSAQEARTLSLYASGLPLKSVARVLGVSYETAKSYLDRSRAKYRAVGRPAGSKIDLRARAIEDGHLAE